MLHFQITHHHGRGCHGGQLIPKTIEAIVSSASFGGISFSPFSLSAFSSESLWETMVVRVGKGTISWGTISP